MSLQQEHEDALEVAKLAAMIGSQLNAVDQLATDRSNNPANKIDINKFVEQVKNPNNKVKPANYLTNVPRGFVAPPSEDEIASMVPDVPRFIPPQEAVQTLPTVTTPSQEIISTLPVAVAPTNQPVNIKPVDSKPKVAPKAVEQTLLTRSDIDSVRNSLKGIDKSLASMLDLLKNSKLLNNE